MRSKPIIAVLMCATLLYGGSSQLVHAGPSCGPESIVRTMNKFCNKFKPNWWDGLASVFVPVYGLSKAALYESCKGIVNSGYLVDILVEDCCVAHDACYERGGTQNCKNACDVEFLDCTTTHLASYGRLGTDLAWKITEAATVGGFLTFNYTDDPNCGQWQGVHEWSRPCQNAHPGSPVNSHCGQVPSSKGTENYATPQSRSPSVLSGKAPVSSSRSPRATASNSAKGYRP